MAVGETRAATAGSTRGGADRSTVVSTAWPAVVPVPAEGPPGRGRGW
jgi:hypothetical protein